MIKLNQEADISGNSSSRAIFQKRSESHFRGWVNVFSIRAPHPSNGDLQLLYASMLILKPQVFMVHLSKKMKKQKLPSI